MFKLTGAALLGGLQRLLSSVAVVVVAGGIGFVWGRIDGARKWKAEVALAAEQSKVKALDWQMTADLIANTGAQQRAANDMTFAAFTASIKQEGDGNAPLDAYLAHASDCLYGNDRMRASDCTAPGSNAQVSKGGFHPLSWILRPGSAH